MIRKICVEFVFSRQSKRRHQKWWIYFVQICVKWVIRRRGKRTKSEGYHILILDKRVANVIKLIMDCTLGWLKQFFFLALKFRQRPAMVSIIRFCSISNAVFVLPKTYIFVKFLLQKNKQMFSPFRVHS